MNQQSEQERLRAGTDAILEAHRAEIVSAEELRRLRLNDARWTYSLMYGFPVRNQTARDRNQSWIAFAPGNKTICCGANPSDAIDSAIDRARQA